MGAKTGIEWTDATWNPLEGCSPVSAGCKNCYASGVARRFGGSGQHYEGLVRINADGEPTNKWNGNVRLAEKHLRDPLKWKPVVEHAADCLRAGDKGNEYCGCSRPRRIFVNSMSDLFHESVPDEWIDKILAVIALCPQHIFQVLTKRPERMLKYFTGKHLNPQKWPAEKYDVQTCVRLSLGGLLKGKTLSNGRPDVMRFFKSGQADRYGEADSRIFKEWPLKNVWLGVSLENQAMAEDRIPLLLQTPAALRFISAEPLLGRVDFWKVSVPARWSPECGGYAGWDWNDFNGETPGGIDWVICGGESGPGARPMHPDWARGLRDQCKAAGVPFFMKQMGSVYGPNKGHDIPADLNVKAFPAVRP